MVSVKLTPVAQNVIYLQPNDSTRCLARVCYSLEALISNDLEALYELSNTTLFLLPGTHIINNKLVSITSTTNLSIKAANLTEGATINCSGNVGFKFTNVSNVDISGIVFDNCGISQLLYYMDSKTEMFTLLIASSYNFTISAVSIKNGKGTGLLVRNVYEHFILSQVAFTMNRVNRNIVIEDEIWSTISNTSIIIEDSVFSFGSLTASPYPESSGIVFKSHVQNTLSFVHVRIINVTTHQNINCSNCYNGNHNMYVKINVCTTSVVIENYTSTYDSPFGLEENDPYTHTEMVGSAFESFSDSMLQVTD